MKAVNASHATKMIYYFVTLGTNPISLAFSLSFQQLRTIIDANILSSHKNTTKCTPVLQLKIVEML